MSSFYLVYTTGDPCDGDADLISDDLAEALSLFLKATTETESAVLVWSA
jgi:hypothetical protein